MVLQEINEGEDRQSCAPLLNSDKDNFDAKIVIVPKRNSATKTESFSNGKEKSSDTQVADFDLIDVGVTTTLNKLESKPIWRRCLGILLALGSTIMFSLNSLVIKFMPEANPFNICVWSFLFAGFLTLPVLVYKSEYKKKTVCQNVIFPFNKHYKTSLFILLRSITSVSAFALLYFSLKYLDIADVTVIISSSTIFVYFFSWLILREDFDLVIIGTGILAIGGVAVITRPPLLTGSAEMDLDILIGTCLAFGCTVLVSISVILIRVLKNVHYSLMNFILYAWGTLQSVAMAVTVGVLSLPKCQSEWILMATVGALNVFAQSFLASALKYEQAGHVTLVRTSSILFSFLWQFIFLGVLPDVLGVIGAAMIVAGIIITIFRKLIKMNGKNKK